MEQQLERQKDLTESIVNALKEIQKHDAMEAEKKAQTSTVKQNEPIQSEEAPAPEVVVQQQQPESDAQQSEPAKQQ